MPRPGFGVSHYQSLKQLSPCFYRSPTASFLFCDLLRFFGFGSILESEEGNGRRCHFLNGLYVRLVLVQP